jgi:hypothetical protein
MMDHWQTAPAWMAWIMMGEDATTEPVRNPRGVCVELNCTHDDDTGRNGKLGRWGHRP